MIVVGLTGSIGTGKSTTAQMFADEGVPVNDADAVVHDIYRNEGLAALRSDFPEAVKNGVVDRQELSRQLAGAPEKLRLLESLVHPLVRQRETAFLDYHRKAGAEMVLLDIPLLYETGGEGRMDTVVVVTCDPQIQRQRVLARPGMTDQKLDMILSRQMPDAEKRRKADFLIDTGEGLDAARQRVKQIIASLKAGRMNDSHA